MDFIYVILLFLIPGGLIALLANKLIKGFGERERKAEEKRLLKQQKKEANKAAQPKSPRSKKAN